MKKLIFSLTVKLFIFSSSFLVLIIIIEILLRTGKQNIEKATNIVDDGPVYNLDNRLIYAFKPDSQGTLRGSDFTDFKKINSFGLRDDEFTNKTDKYRIIAVGDSFTEGIGVERSSSYPEILQSLLGQKKVDTEVINAGVSGYSPDQEYRFIIEKLSDFKPNLIIWNFTYPYDLYDSSLWYPSLYKIEKNMIKAGNGWFNWLYFQNFLSLYSPSFVKKSYLYTYAYNKLPSVALLNGRPKLSEDQLIDWSIEKFKLQITDLKSRNDIIVAFLPTKDSLKIKGGFDILKYEMIVEYKTRMKKILEGVNCKFIDVGEDLEKYLNYEQIEDLYYKSDIHPNGKGNEIIAEVVAEKVFEFYFK